MLTDDDRSVLRTLAQLRRVSYGTVRDRCGDEPREGRDFLVAGPVDHDVRRQGAELDTNLVDTVIELGGDHVDDTGTDFGDRALLVLAEGLDDLEHELISVEARLQTDAFEPAADLMLAADFDVGQGHADVAVAEVDVVSGQGRTLIPFPLFAYQASRHDKTGHNTPKSVFSQCISHKNAPSGGKFIDRLAAIT